MGASWREEGGGLAGGKKVELARGEKEGVAGGDREVELARGEREVGLRGKWG